MALNTTQKFRDFTGEPLRDKAVNEVPGIGPTLARNLETSGITRVKSSIHFFTIKFHVKIIFTRLMNCLVFT